MIGGEDDQRIAHPSHRLKRIQHASEMVVDLCDETHVCGPHMADDLVARKAPAFIVLAVRAHHRMLVGGAVLRPMPDRTDILAPEQFVEGRRREIRPMRIDVGKVQHPRFARLRTDPIERKIGHVSGLGVAFFDTGRQMRVAQVPTGHDAATVDGADHEIGPRVFALVAARAQPFRIARLDARRRVTIVAVDDDKAPFAQQRTALGFDLDAEPPQCLGVGEHVRLAGQCRRASRRTQVIAKR